MDICRDLADGRLDGTYSAADMAAFQQDPTVQGYCVAVATPPPAVVAPGCTYTGANGQMTTTTAGSAACKPCVYVGVNGQTTTTTPTVDANGAVTCSEATPPATTTTAVGSSTHVKNAAPAGKPVTTAQVEGAQKTKTKPNAPTRQTAAPLASTRTAGTLPFTGAQLTVFALVGLALLAGGLLLRLTGREKRSGT